MSWLPVSLLPTAQTSVGEMAVTELSTPPPASVGVAWTLQVLPLKNSTSGVESRCSRFAHGADVAAGRGGDAVEDAGAFRGHGGRGPGRAVEVLDQGALSPLARVPEPTAKMSVGEIAETALRVEPETLVTTWKPLERSWRDSS